MGLILDLYRSDYDSTLNVFHGKRQVTVVNAAGPFDPTDDAPAALLATNAFGNPIIVPATRPDGMAGPMDGGTYAATSDSRLRDAQVAVAGYAIYGGLPVHDRFER